MRAEQHDRFVYTIAFNVLGSSDPAYFDCTEKLVECFGEGFPKRELVTPAELIQPQYCIQETH